MYMKNGERFLAENLLLPLSLSLSLSLLDDDDDDDDEIGRR